MYIWECICVCVCVHMVNGPMYRSRDFAKMS